MTTYKEEKTEMNKSTLVALVVCHAFKVSERGICVTFILKFGKSHYHRNCETDYFEYQTKLIGSGGLPHKKLIYISKGLPSIPWPSTS
jgi:hypothetical protein